MGKLADTTDENERHCCTCIYCRRKKWHKIKDDADLDELLDVDEMDGGQYFLLDDQSHRSDESLDATFNNPGFTSSVSSVNLETTPFTNGRAILRKRTSEPVFIRDNLITSSGRPLLPKSLSLPLHVPDLPDPFPELAGSSSAASPVEDEPDFADKTEKRKAKSSPASPILERLIDTGGGERRLSCDSSESLSPLQSPTDSQENLTSDSSFQKTCNDLRMWRPTGYVKTMLHFYNYDDNSSHIVSINEKMSGRDVCQQLINKYRALDDKNWNITEQIPKFQLERNLEDHEIVYHIYRSWGNTEGNKFFFKKDYRKYELFQNPNQFFPSNMVDPGSIKDVTPAVLCTGQERYKNILLRMLFEMDRLPEIQGFMSVKEGKKSWKKYFCVLRPTGLYYSTKGTSKDPRHLVLFSQFSDANIYTANNAKKTFGAPNNNCICLKPPYCVSDAKELKLLCAEDEQARLCWITGMRLVKYGSTIPNNYKESTSYADRLKSIENKCTTTNSGTARVPMDFTGPGGRVVEDPWEAQAVALAEAHHWRKKAALRKPPSSPMSQSPKGVTISENPNYHPHSVSMFIHLTQPWYHSCISREEAVNLIGQQGAVDGVFLVRESNSITGAYVLSLAHNYKIKHCQIGQIEYDGQWFYSLDGGQTKFTDLLQLVEFYQLNAGGLPTKLTHYVSKL